MGRPLERKREDTHELKAKDVGVLEIPIHKKAPYRGYFYDGAQGRNLTTDTRIFRIKWLFR